MDRVSAETPFSHTRREHHYRGRHDLETAFFPKFLQDVVEHFQPGRHDVPLDRLACRRHNGASPRKRGASGPIECLGDFREGECHLGWIGGVQLVDKSQHGLLIEAGACPHESQYTRPTPAQPI